MDPHAQAQARNRENQRRSRARRKDYVAGLESRIRRFEREGVQATAEVQAAARRVKEENALLRGLLALAGVSTRRVEEYLNETRSSEAGPSPPTLSRRPTQVEARPVPTTPLLPKPPMADGPRGKLERVNAVTGDATPLVARQKPLVPTPEQPQLGSPPTSAGPQAEIPMSPTATAPPTQAKRSGPSIASLCNDNIAPPPPASSSWPTPESQNASLSTSAPSRSRPTTPDLRDETSCEVAARIIAGMRGGDDVDGVCSELGCGSKQICTVKNIKVLEVMDR